MGSIKYLNCVLTLLALLLTLNLYASWMTTPGGEALSLSSPAHAQGLPNAGAQRKQMVDQLKLVNVKLDAIGQLLVDGSVRATVEAQAQGGE